MTRPDDKGNQVGSAPDARPGAERKSRRRFIKRAILGIGALVLADGIWEANRIEVRRYRRVLPGLPPGSTTIRVAQLSDLHRGPVVPEAVVRRAVALANAERPDIVLLTGDFVTASARYADSCVRALSGLRPRMGAWAVLGNHEYWVGAPAYVEAALRRIGCEVLTNASRRLRNGVYIVGVDDHMSGRPDVAEAYRDVPAGAPVIAMSHSPLEFRDLARRPCVSFSGHTHGGQALYPFRSWYVTRLYGYVEGWYRQGAASLYVNRGVGVGAIFPLRYGVRPEVAVVDLVAA